MVPSHTTFDLQEAAQDLDDVVLSILAEDPITGMEYVAYVDDAHMNTGAAHWLVQTLSPVLLPLLENKK